MELEIHQIQLYFVTKTGLSKTYDFLILQACVWNAPILYFLHESSKVRDKVLGTTLHKKGEMSLGPNHTRQQSPRHKAEL